MKLKIALLQLLPGKDLTEQIMIGKKACEKAKAMGAHIALFPEILEMPPRYASAAERVGQ